jgi:hypothetical protein
MKKRNLLFIPYLFCVFFPFVNFIPFLHYETAPYAGAYSFILLCAYYVKKGVRGGGGVGIKNHIFIFYYWYVYLLSISDWICLRKFGIYQERSVPFFLCF